MDRYLIINGKKLGFSMEELNLFTVSYFYELIDSWVDVNKEDSNDNEDVLVADQDYYDRMFNRG